MITEAQQNVEMIIPKQIKDFRSLMQLALVSESEFCDWFDIETMPQLRKNQVDSGMCRLFEQGLKNHRLQGDNYG